MPFCKGLVFRGYCYFQKTRPLLELSKVGGIQRIFRDLSEVPVVVEPAINTARAGGPECGGKPVKWVTWRKMKLKGGEWQKTQKELVFIAVRS